MSNKSQQDSLIDLQDNLRHDIEKKEAVFNYWVSRVMMFGLLIIPLVPASLTFMSISTNFPALLHIGQNMAYFVGAITAFGIEFLGLMTLRTALRMSKYNQQAKALGLPQSPAWQGWTTAGCYVLIILSIVVLLKIFPQLVMWSLIPMSLMAAIAEWGFLLNADQSERDMEARKKLITMSSGLSTETLQAEIETKDAAIVTLAATVTELMKVVETLQHNIETRFSELQGQVTEVSTGLQEMVTEVSVEFQGQVTGIADQLQTMKAGAAMFQPTVESGLQEPVTSLKPAVTEVTAAVTSDCNLQDEVTTVVTSDCNLRHEATEPVISYKSKAERQSALIRYIATNLNGETSDKLNKSQIGKLFKTSHVTIGKDIEELIESNKLSVNGHITLL